MRRPFKFRHLFLLPLLAAGCVSPQVLKDVFSGRAALRLGEPAKAVPYFEAAARLDPGYITDFTVLNVGIWTYLGRAYYESGDISKARESLERAKAAHSNDYLARVYLGLALSSRSDTRPQAVRELRAGLEGLARWLQRLPGSSPQGRYWDPGDYIANRVSQTLALLRPEQPDWEAVKENVLWLGRALEQEILDVQFEINQERNVTDQT